MSKIHSFPKIFPIGSDFIPDIFKGAIEITEKIDGSQFGFGITKEGEVVIRSKGKEMTLDAPERMFDIAANYVSSIQDKLRTLLETYSSEGIYFYGEYLGGPSHNILKYARVPKNNIMIFGVRKGEAFIHEYSELQWYADFVDLETVPLIYKGEIKSFEELEKFMSVDSALGNEKIEGIVCKNYASPAFLGNMVIPSMGKYVREDFKERHAKDWDSKFSGKSKMEAFIGSFRGDEARFHKAVQHLTEQGLLTNSPKDIGLLLKELEKDFVEEEKEGAKEKLWQIHADTFLRVVRAGFPEWYKKHLAEKAFN